MSSYGVPGCSKSKLEVNLFTAPSKNSVIARNGTNIFILMASENFNL